MHDDPHATPSKANILVVDDTHANLHILVDLLSEHGYLVRPVPNGHLALSAAQIEPPDLILLDIKMPGMSGYEVCERLKADERTQNIPVIFISALNDVGDKVKAFSLGGVDYIPKPFQAQEVIARVETHLTLRNLQKQLEQNNACLQQEILERQRTEEQLTRYKAHLEELVEQRTMELQKSYSELQEKNLELQRSKESLKDAKEAADVAHKAKSEFIANISHELRTPLNSILGYAQLFRGSPDLREEQQEALETIYQSGQHLLMIINDLIDLSTLEAGKMGLKEHEFPLPQFLDNIIKMFKMRAEQKGLAFECAIATDIPYSVRGDEGRLRQILLNLLGNAVKFTEQGRVAFRVATCSFESEQHRPACPDFPLEESEAASIVRIRFHIEDTGRGIPPEQVKAIFAAFKQLGDKNLAQAEGPGLGLTISQRLVHMMGGELHLQSTLEKGSTFWFDLDVPALGKNPQAS
ncbi:response regulator [candidate division KSB3 bacterium]|uniref:histidine kinase n=1 Tax=candidate division KSB3 bacterium TaxID=2044937 RepID=A0A9D5Q5N2_9BACT|nr:response regulator [candidate division KSB3 bacterium]MBD3325004.1 response regulator [candidate division KSB3 bacterium]